VGDTVTNKLAGHFRIGPSGIEFATGYDDSTIPRSIVCAAVSRSIAPSAGWMHAYARPKGVRVLEITACTCGVPLRFLPRDLRLRLG
jgi:hypothetical protein